MGSMPRQSRGLCACLTNGAGRLRVRGAACSRMGDPGGIRYIGRARYRRFGLTEAMLWHMPDASLAISSAIFTLPMHGQTRTPAESGITSVGEAVVGPSCLAAEAADLERGSMLAGLLIHSTP
ncbi:hypothetical protein ACCO45_000959 [Purpureocillium lilacinum]|uniref:Uncharacterized protein n=1 Tax=Purpureocillium lilacinum TaxID=33203 RepID=A0ACC4E5N9_PURLI